MLYYFALITGPVRASSMNLTVQRNLPWNVILYIETVHLGIDAWIQELAAWLVERKTEHVLDAL